MRNGLFWYSTGIHRNGKSNIQQQFTDFASFIKALNVTDGGRSRHTSLEDTDSLLIEIGTIFDGFNKKIKANNDIVGDIKTKKVSCKQEGWEYLADYLKADVVVYRAKVAALDKEISDLPKEMEQLKKMDWF